MLYGLKSFNHQLGSDEYRAAQVWCARCQKRLKAESSDFCSTCGNATFASPTAAVPGMKLTDAWVKDKDSYVYGVGYTEIEFVPKEHGAQVFVDAFMGRADILQLRDALNELLANLKE